MKTKQQKKTKNKSQYMQTKMMNGSERILLLRSFFIDKHLTIYYILLMMTNQ